MLKESKEKVGLKDDLIEKEKKIKKKRLLKKTVLSAMLLPVLGISLFQSSYMAINDQAKNIVSNAEVNHAAYLLSPKFTEDYYYDHLTKKDYTNAQYQQDLQTYDRYQNEIKMIYRNEVSSNSKMLAIFPELKTESGFVNDLNSNPVASYITFSKFYDMENSTEKGQNRDVSYQGFKKEVIRNALINYNKGDLSQEQLDFFNDFNDQQENSINYSMSEGVKRLNTMDQNVFSPMSPLGDFSAKSKLSKFYNLQSFQNDEKYTSLASYSYVNSNINAANDPVKEKKRLIESFENDPRINFKNLNKNDQTKYLSMLKNSIDFFQKYQSKDGTISDNDLSKYKPVSVQNLNEMEKSDPVKFKNTLMLIRYASDIDNARMNVFNRKAGNYSNVNFGILNLLNAANYYSSFSFLNHNISASTFNLGYMSSGDNDALRIAMSGFYEDKGDYIKNGKHYDVKYDTISYSPEINYLKHKGF